MVTFDVVEEVRVEGRGKRRGDVTYKIGCCVNKKR